VIETFSKKFRIESFNMHQLWQCLFITFCLLLKCREKLHIRAKSAMHTWRTTSIMVGCDKKLIKLLSIHRFSRCAPFKNIAHWQRCYIRWLHRFEYTARREVTSSSTSSSSEALGKTHITSSTTHCQSSPNLCWSWHFNEKIVYIMESIRSLLYGKQQFLNRKAKA
jgi:hypothetical protein